jgi:CspA family cold shock protein
MEERQTGHVIWFSDPRGFGFICPDGHEPGDNDIFFYYAYLRMEGFKTVKPNSRVSFEVGENHQGPMAVNVLVEDDADEDTED